MPVLSAFIITKAGKMLVSRQFVEMSRVRIEGLVAAFPKLVEAGTQHTFVETEGVRYVFQPLDQLYLVLVTNKQSNIMDDLDTLQMMAKLVGEYCTSTNEEGVVNGQFELIFAFDEVLALGHKESVTLQQITTYLEMDSHEEKLHQIIMESKMNEAREEARRKADEIDRAKAKLRSMHQEPYQDTDHSYNDSSTSSYTSSSRSTYTPAVEEPSRPEPVRQKSKSSAKSKPLRGLRLKKTAKEDDFVSAFTKENKLPSGGFVAPPIVEAPVEEPEQTGAVVRVAVNEQMLVLVDDDCELQKMEIKGEMKLTVTNPDDSRVAVSMTRPPSDIKFKTPSKVNLKLWNSDNTIALVNPDHAWIVGSHKSTAVLKYRMAGSDSSQLPIKFALWADQEDEETLVVTLEYNHENKDFSLTDVVISIPCPNPPDVRACSGNTPEYDSEFLVWSIGDVDANEPSGSLEFAVEGSSVAALKPIAISLQSNNTFSGLQIVAVRRPDNTEVDHECVSTLSCHKFHIVSGD